MGWDSEHYVRHSQIGWYFIKDDLIERFRSIYANTTDAFQLDNIVFKSTGKFMIHFIMNSKHCHHNIVTKAEQRVFRSTLVFSSITSTLSNT